MVAKRKTRSTAAQAALEPLRDFAERVAGLHAESLEIAVPTRVADTVRKWLSRLDLETENEDDLRIVATAMGLAVELESFTPSLSGAMHIDRLARRRKLTAGELAAAEALRKARFSVFVASKPLGDGLFAAEDLGSGRDLTIYVEDLPAAAMTVPLAAWLCTFPDGQVVPAGVILPLDDAGRAVAQDFVKPGRGIANGPRCAAAVYRHVVRNGGPVIVGLNDLPDDLADEEEHADVTRIDSIVVELVATGRLHDIPRDIEEEVRRLVAPLELMECLFKSHRSRSKAFEDMAALYRRFAELMIEAIHVRSLAGLAQPAISLDAMAATIDREVATNDYPREAAELFRDIRQSVTAATGRRDKDEGLARVIERIRGLRAKTVDQGCTEEEALAAADKVAELLDRYGLSLSEIDLRQQPCLGAGIGSRRKRIGAIDDVAPDIARFCDCRSWFERAADGTIRTIFFGLPADVEAASFLHERVGQAFETETAAFQRGSLYQELAGGGRTKATTSFQFGLSRGIRAKLAQRKAERDAKSFAATGRDLVPLKSSIVDDEFAKLGLSLSATAISGRTVLTEAYEAGQVAGATFTIESEIAEA